MMWSSIKDLVIILGGNGNARSHLQEVLRMLPLLEVTSDVYLVSENLIADTSTIKDILNQVSSFLHQYSFYRITIHPVHPLDSPRSLTEVYRDLFGATHPFNQEAYLHQSVSRLMILPITKVEKESEEGEVAPFLEFLRERNMIPCLYLPKGNSFTSFQKLVRTEQERIYLEIGEGSTQEKTVYTLCAHMELDNLLRWAHAPVKTELPVCRSLIFSENDGRAYLGSLGFGSGGTVHSLSPENLLESGDMLATNQDHLLTYATEVLCQLKETLTFNHREKEAAKILFHLGLEWVKREDYQKALSLFDEVLTSPRGMDNQDAVFISKALCLLKLHDIKGAQATLDEAEKSNASLAMIYYYRGFCEFELKDYIEAIELFKKALEGGVDQFPVGDAYFYMALSHINIMEYDDGLLMLKEAEKVYALDQISPVYYYMGVCHFGKNEVDTAYRFFQNALAANPKEEDLSSMYLYLGICHKEKGEYLKAIEELKKARAAEEDRLEVHNLMGFCYYKLKEYDKAIECFVRAVEINPNSAIDWANLGVNVRARGEDNKAILLFKKALRLDSTIWFARKHLDELIGAKNK